MLATATIDHPDNSFFLEPETRATGTAQEGILPLHDAPNAAVIRAKSLQANIQQLKKLLEPEGATKFTLWGDFFRRQLQKGPAPQTILFAARPAFISWLLDFKAWGVETENLKASVCDLLILEKGWNGDDAEAITIESVEHACAFIDALGPRARLFEPFPDPDGLVGLEARKHDKAAYLSFYKDGLIAYAFRAGDAIHRGNKATPNAVMRVLDAVFWALVCLSKAVPPRLPSFFFAHFGR